MGFLDNIITAISPEAGYKREAWRQALEELRGYDAASHGRLNSGWSIWTILGQLKFWVWALGIGVIGVIKILTTKKIKSEGRNKGLVS